MEYLKSYQDLIVWQKSMLLVKVIYERTASFPKEEMFSLTSQMKRAADSISLNIAEGSTGQSDPEQSKFLGYAQRSAVEVVNCLYLAIKRKYIDQQQFDKFYSELERLILKIQALKKYIKNKT